jgi:hypothetical protein
VSAQRGSIVRAGLAAAACSGIPSTAWTLARGEDPLEAGRAAGAILLRGEHATPALLAAAVPVHLALSLGWAAILDAVLPERRPAAWGLAAGAAIAALDLGVIGRRIPAIRALPQGRQWTDHLAFGLTAGVVLRRRRSCSRGRSCARPLRRAAHFDRPIRG